MWLSEKTGPVTGVAIAGAEASAGIAGTAVVTTADIAGTGMVTGSAV